MDQSYKGSINVYVLSTQEGCRLTGKLLLGNKYDFKFVNFQKEVQLDSPFYLVVDENQKVDQLIDHPKCYSITLKDTQKSPASIFSLSGQLSTFGQNQKHQFLPSYLLDFVVGIGLAIYLLQLKNSTNSLLNKKFSISLVQLAQYYGSFNISAKQNGFLRNPLGQNLLDGGAPFYSLYKCKEGTLAVGNLEPKFYSEMVKGLKLDKQTHEFLMKHQFNTETWSSMRQIFKQTFLKKSAAQWQKIMSSYDTCVTEVSQKPRDEFRIQPQIFPLTKSKL